MILSADTIVQSAYDRSAGAEAYAASQAGKISSISALEENLTPLIKNIALGGIALIVAIAIIKSKRKNPSRKKSIREQMERLSQKRHRLWEHGKHHSKEYRRLGDRITALQSKIGFIDFEDVDPEAAYE